MQRSFDDIQWTYTFTSGNCPYDVILFILPLHLIHIDKVFNVIANMSGLLQDGDQETNL